MNEQEELEFYQLCDRLFEGAISAAEQKKLEEILRDNQSAREAYVRRSALHTSLIHYANDPQTDAAAPAAQSTSKGRLLRFSSATLKMAAAITIGFFLAVLFSWKSPSGSHKQLASHTDEEATYEGAAVLIQAHEVNWGEGNHAYRAGDSIPKGHFRMQSGVVQLEFYSGATMILEGKTDLEIHSPDNAFCHFGKMSVAVSAHARGFSIATPDHEFIDLGTEFGLTVKPGQPSELHVFSGEVEVYNRSKAESDTPMETLETGDAARFEAVSEASVVDLRINSFWNVQQLSEQADQLESGRYLQWLEYSKALVERSDLISYFPFYQTKRWVRKLENTVKSANDYSHGAIVGSQWQEGRWPEKSALRFNTPSDRVRFNISGEYDSITFAAWVKVESLKNTYNGLCMTDGFEPGNPHWQIMHDGKIQLGIRNTQEMGQSWQYSLQSPTVITPSHFGQWVHIATTFDGKTSQISHFFNGQQVSQSKPRAQADCKIVFGSGELGNWGLPKGNKSQKIRNLDGTMDEFMLFDRVLNTDEVAELYESGRR